MICYGELADRVVRETFLPPESGKETIFSGPFRCRFFNIQEKYRLFAYEESLLEYLDKGIHP